MQEEEDVSPEIEQYCLFLLQGTYMCFLNMILQSG